MHRISKIQFAILLQKSGAQFRNRLLFTESTPLQRFIIALILMFFFKDPQLNAGLNASQISSEKLPVDSPLKSLNKIDEQFWI